MSNGPDPLEELLIESEGIYLVQASPNEPASWYGTEQNARDEAQKIAIALNKKVYVFRAVAMVEPTNEPVRWTTIAAHGPAIQ